MLLFTIYDKKAACHINPFFVANKATAVRGFERLVNDSRSDVSLFPADFALYFCGEFHDTDGKFDSVFPPEFVVDASPLVKKTASVKE